MSQRETDPWGDPCFRADIAPETVTAAEDAAWAASVDLELGPVFVSWVGTSRFSGPYAFQWNTAGEVRKSQPDRIRLTWRMPSAEQAALVAAHEVRHLWQLKTGKFMEHGREWAEEDADAYANTIPDVLRRVRAEKGAPPVRAAQLKAYTDRRIAISAQNKAMDDFDKLFTLDNDALLAALRQINATIESKKGCGCGCAGKTTESGWLVEAVSRMRRNYERDVCSNPKLATRAPFCRTPLY